jgi:hypothetical protein
MTKKQRRVFISFPDRAAKAMILVGGILHAQLWTRNAAAPLAVDSGGKISATRLNRLPYLSNATHHVSNVNSTSSSSEPRAICLIVYAQTKSPPPRVSWAFSTARYSWHMPVSVKTVPSQSSTNRRLESKQVLPCFALPAKISRTNRR